MREGRGAEEVREGLGLLHGTAHLLQERNNVHVLLNTQRWE